MHRNVWTLFHLEEPCKGGAIIIFILRYRELRLREVKYDAQSHVSSKW